MKGDGLMKNPRACGLLLPAAMMTILSGAFAAERMPAPQQTALVQKYCAVCHTESAKNGGLSLQHYDAARPDPQRAAMLLSKLRNGAMGAAGLAVPDAATREAWVSATVAQGGGGEELDQHPQRAGLPPHAHVQCCESGG